MKKRFKRILSIFTAFTMVFTLFGGIAVASNDTGFDAIDKFYFVEKGNNLEIGVTGLVYNGDGLGALDDDVYGHLYANGGAVHKTSNMVDLDNYSNGDQVPFVFDLSDIDAGKYEDAEFSITDDENERGENAGKYFDTKTFDLLVGTFNYQRGGSRVTGDSSADVGTGDRDGAELTARIRQLDGAAWLGSTWVGFTIQSDRDAERIVRDISADYWYQHKVNDSTWYIFARTNASGEVDFLVRTTVPGTVELDFYRGFATTGAFQEEFEIDFSRVDDVGELELETDLGRSRNDVEVYDKSYDARDLYIAEAGDSFELAVLAVDANGWEVEDARVKIQQSQYNDRDEDWGRWRDIATVRTDDDGEAEYDHELTEAGLYKFRANWDDGEVTQELNKPVMVVAGDNDEIVANKAKDFHDVDDREFYVYFKILDEYGNAVGKYYDGDMDEDGNWDSYFDFRVTTPDGDRYTHNDALDGEDEVSAGFGHEDETDMFYVKVNYREIDQDGEYEVRGSISGTTKRAFTTVTAKEFGDVVDMRMELDPNIVHVEQDAFRDGASYQIDYDDWLMLIDEEGMEIVYDPGDRDVLFSSSRSSVASVSSRRGHITLRDPGETVISAYFEDEGLEAEDTLYVGDDPTDLSVVPDIEYGALTGTVTMYMLDEDGYRTQRQDGKDEEYRITRQPGAITISNIEDFEDGVATFEVEADDFGLYEGLRVITDEGLTKTFDLEFIEEAPVTERTVIMTIGSSDYSIDGEAVRMDTAPYIDPATDRTLVPFRAAAEALGAEVEWDGDARTITTMLGEREVVMTIGETEFTVDGAVYEMDQAPVITEDDRTVVPMRALAEAFDAEVDWDQDTRQITIILAH